MENMLSLKVGNFEFKSPSSLPQPDTGASVITNAITIFISASIIIAVLYVIFAGIKWITSAGDKQKLAAARAHLTWAIIGLIIVLVSFLIINAVNYLFDINLLEFPL